MLCILPFCIDILSCFYFPLICAPLCAQVESVSWSASKGDRTLLAVGQKDGGVAVWSLDSSGGCGNGEKPQHIGLLWGHPGKPVVKLLFHPDTGQ